jgi:hypothetical protein
MQFLAELLETARRRGVGVLLYSGNDDSIISHYGTRGEKYLMWFHVIEFCG